MDVAVCIFSNNKKTAADELNGDCRWILVFSVPPLSLSLPIVLHLSSITSWAKVWDDKRQGLVDCCVFVALSLTFSLCLQEPADWDTGDGSDMGGTGRNGEGSGQRGWR